MLFYVSPFYVFLFVSLYVDVLYFLFFFFNDTATTEIYTLSLHDALPIYRFEPFPRLDGIEVFQLRRFGHAIDRKSTRLNSSHDQISYAVFCLKKKKLTCRRQSFRAGTTMNSLRAARADASYYLSLRRDAA